MATSGTHSVRAMWDRPMYLKFSWNRTRVSTSGNYSVISWKLEWVSEDSTPCISIFATDWDVNVNGNTYSGSFNNTTTGVETKTITSGTETIYHQADGTMAFFYSFSYYVGLTYGTKSGSGTAILDTIPRRATITSAPTFTDEDNPTITYSNPAGNAATSLQACISFTGVNDDIPYRDIPKTGTSYTFNLTDAERQTLQDAVTTGSYITVRFYVKTVVAGSTYHSYVTRNMSLAEVMPVLAPTVYDSNARTVALTGDNTTFIKYYSNATFNTGARAVSGATITSQYVINGAQRYDDVSTGTFEGVESNTFYFSVTDSRGHTTKDALVRDLIPYVKLTSSLNTDVLTANGELTFTVSGKYFNGSFGAQNNEMEVEYMILDENGDPVFNFDGSGWVQLGVVTPTVNDGNYEYSYTITGLDYYGQYELTVNVIDQLTPVQSSSTIIQATPVFDWGQNDFKHHTNVYIDNNKTIRSYQSDGTDVQILGLNTSNGTVLGWGGYDNSNGDTSVYGNNVRIHTKEKLLINGREYGANKVLWESTGWYMNGGQAANLSEPISAQPNGIVLVFSLYRNGAPEDVSINSFFVSKKEVELLPNAPHTFFMMINSGFSVIGAKYLYIDDEVITGHATNSTAGSNNNLTYNNDNFVLRYVIGV